MSEKNTQLTKTVHSSPATDDVGLFPFIIAGMICFTIAVILGTGSWLLFGSRRQMPPVETAAVEEELNPPSSVSENEIQPAESPSPQVESPPVVEETNAAAKPEIENMVEVSGGEVVIGGGDTKIPLERQIVGDFLIAETEVTNAQYAEFLRETNHPPPPGWNKTEFPEGTGNFPAANVSWQDAAAFCEWLGRKKGLTIRLPTEAEWERAARGIEGNKYPWGNEWNKAAIVTKESGGKVSAVKSFPLNRSPFGAFDMAGNVWEWTSDKVNRQEKVTDEQVENALEDGKNLRVVKGGSASEKASQISAQARYEIPEKTKVPMVGFRYVIVRN